ncbi:hypothetical protein [Spirosoma oryzicola]|uniref:hypothetical protein n=1 Tax=Spirosoma oryzicola TaxID=2898794 RepID=UPI001E5E78F6|nr:hypothetical protein [Spirosoma oryzicola]UHG94719.1 hypothetical protein LQ777_28670 [Spirosoma oryzicola]
MKKQILWLSFVMLITALGHAQSISQLQATTRFDFAYVTGVVTNTPAALPSDHGEPTRMAPLVRGTTISALA